jgi:carboxymethylenebutenolidase
LQNNKIRMSISSDCIIEVQGVQHYIARPPSSGGRAVLLLPHNQGIDEFVRGFADRLATRGLTTLAWNPYPGLKLGAPFSERPPRPDDHATVKMLSACIDTMETTLGITATAIVGFCMGGRFALIFGSQEPRARAVVACYPSLPVQRSPGQDIEPLPSAASIKCPVQLVYPGKDQVTSRPVFQALQGLLQGRASDTSVLYYPDAEHGFMHVPGPANDIATGNAVPQIDAFLDRYLADA